jgi:hypothetical protein
MQKNRTTSSTDQIAHMATEESQSSPDRQPAESDAGAQIGNQVVISGRGHRFSGDVIGGNKLTISGGNQPAGDENRAQSERQTITCLFLAANPQDTPALRLDREIREIEAKIRASDHRDVLKLVSAWAVRPDDLLQMLNVHRPQIVQFSGHSTTTGSIVLENDQGETVIVSERALQALFTTMKDNIKLVILNACYAEIQARSIASVIDCVIGMSAAITDEGASIFAASFYRAIGFGRSIKAAFDQGVTALLLANSSDTEMPQLLTRSGIDPDTVVLIKTNAPRTAT